MATSSISPTYGLLCFAKGGSSAPNQVNGLPITLPEIHLNIWERDPDKKSSQSEGSSLDIGLMIDVNDQTQSIELIFPTKIPLNNIKDLSVAVSAPTAVPIIFNESWAVNSNGTHSTDSVVHDPRKPSMAFAIVSTSGSIKEDAYLGHDALSINVPALIAKGQAVAASLRQTIGRVYVRFRVLSISRQFYCVGTADHNESWWMPLWQRTEDIDFRLNVRRGAPVGLENTIGRFVEFSKVHLFLMRSRDKDIVFQDKLFNASRSLEDETFWAQYSLIGLQNIPLETSLKRVQNSLGYHWKAKADTVPITEFATLARFKIVEFGIGKFLLVALLLGGTGNALWDGVKEVWGHFKPVIEHSVSDTGTARAADVAKAMLGSVNQTSGKRETK